MSKKEKNFQLKIPVYTTEIIEDAEGLFGGATYQDMYSFIDNKTKEFVQNRPKILYENYNKTKKTVIKEIVLKEHQLGATKGFLVKALTYTTNLYDGYFEGDEKINFKRDNKLGTDNNYFFIYPQIKGLEKNKYQHYFIVLVYEDPHKNSDDILKICKLALNKIFKTPIRNIKLPTLLDELRLLSKAQEFQMKFTAIHFNDNDVELKCRDYLTDGTLKRQKIEKYKNIPIPLVEEMIFNKNVNDYDKVESKIINGKKEYKITKDLLKEANDVINETAEKVFNATSVITENELDTLLFDEDFIISKLAPILVNYLSDSNE